MYWVDATLDKIERCNFDGKKRKVNGALHAIYQKQSILWCFGTAKVTPAVIVILLKTGWVGQWLIVHEIWGSIPGPIKLDTVSPRARTATTFLRSCVAHALSREDEPRHSLHASAQYRDYNEDLI